MKITPSTIQTGKRRAGRYRQVTAAMRDRILRGEFKPGMLLPTMHELAEQYDTSFFTVQTALKPLEEEGLVEKKKRVGTIVKHHAAALTTAAIYCSGNGLDPHHDAFRAELCRQLSLQLTGQDVHPETFIDPRPQEQQHEPLPSLLRAIERNEVQALLVVGCDQVSLPWLSHLPTTASFLGSDRSTLNRVTCKQKQMLQLGLSQLHERGCRTIGVICTVQNSPHLPLEAYERQFYRNLIEIIGDIGLRTRDTWMAVPDTWHKNLEEYGYNQFMEIYKQSERPDGILVYPDVAARGVITAALQQGIHAPEEIHLVMHRNSGVDWFCPLPVDWVETDTSLWAEKMIEQVRQQKAGETVSKIDIAFNLIKHES